METSAFNELDKNIEKALIAVHQHSQHDLDLGYRQAIWAALGPQADETKQVDIGKKRRLFLAIFSAKYVLPLWEKIRPNDKTPHRLLAKAEQSLLEKVVSLHDDYMAGMYIMEGLEYEPAIMVGYSAVKTLSVAMWDERFDPTNIDYNLTNADLDSDYTDVALLASCAYADGSIWEEGSSKEKRLEFWKWWLTKAVPAAWSAF
jgi:hypothetical protein